MSACNWSRSIIRTPGGCLEKTVESYNRSVGSWDSRLVPSLRKMRELGVSNGEEPEAPRTDRSAGAPSARGERVLKNPY